VDLCRGIMPGPEAALRQGTRSRLCPELACVVSYLGAALPRAAAWFHLPSAGTYFHLLTSNLDCELL
jgi:hypothetical protein